jgi:hypothetical protein
MLIVSLFGSLLFWSIAHSVLFRGWFIFLLPHFLCCFASSLLSTSQNSQPNFPTLDQLSSFSSLSCFWIKLIVLECHYQNRQVCRRHLSHPSLRALLVKASPIGFVVRMDIPENRRHVGSLLSLSDLASCAHSVERGTTVLSRF